MPHVTPVPLLPNTSIRISFLEPEFQNLRYIFASSSSSSSSPPRPLPRPLLRPLLLLLLPRPLLLPCHPRPLPRLLFGGDILPEQPPRCKLVDVLGRLFEILPFRSGVINLFIALKENVLLLCLISCLRKFRQFACARSQGKGRYARDAHGSQRNGFHEQRRLPITESNRKHVSYPRPKTIRHVLVFALDSDLGLRLLRFPSSPPLLALSLSALLQDRSRIARKRFRFSQLLKRKLS